MIDYGVLERELNAALDCYFLALSKLEEFQSLYAVGFYTHDELKYISPTANSNSDNDPVIMWSPPDWPLHLYANDCFTNVEAELDKGWEEDFSDFQISHERVIEIMFAALKRFRDQHFRETNVAIGVFMGGMANKLVFASVRHINPSQVVGAFERTNPRI
jgi:hypothetical protein